MNKKVLVSSIAKGIRRGRKRLGLTIEEFSEIVGVDHFYLAHLETASKTPSMKTLAKIIDALKITPGELFRGAAISASAPGDLERRVHALLLRYNPKQRQHLVAILARLDPDQIEPLRRLLRA